MSEPRTDTMSCACGCGTPVVEREWRRPSRPQRFIHGHNASKGRTLPNEAPECACGCGESIVMTKAHRYSGLPRFKNGHHSRMRPPPGWAAPTGICECGCGGKTAVAAKSKPSAGVYAGYPRRFIKGHRAKPPAATMPAEVLTGFRCIEQRDGYVDIYVLNHPRYAKRKKMREHRYMMEVALGRFLERHEQVHHKNGDRTDNRPENLELWKGNHPSGVRSADYHCPGCRCHEH